MNYNLKPILSINDVTITHRELVEFYNVYLNHSDVKLTVESESLLNHELPYVIDSNGKEVLQYHDKILINGDVIHFRNDEYLLYRDYTDYKGIHQFQFINLKLGNLCISNEDYNLYHDLNDRTKYLKDNNYYDDIKLSKGKLPLTIMGQKLDSDGNYIDPYIYFSNSILDKVTTIPGTLLIFNKDKDDKYTFDPIISWKRSTLLDIFDYINDKLISPTVLDIEFDTHNINADIPVKFGKLNVFEDYVFNGSNLTDVTDKDTHDYYTEEIGDFKFGDPTVESEDNSISDYISFNANDGDICSIKILYSKSFITTPLKYHLGDEKSGLGFIRMDGFVVQMQGTHQTYPHILMSGKIDNTKFYPNTVNKSDNSIGYVNYGDGFRSKGEIKNSMIELDINLTLHKDLNSITVEDLFEIQFDTNKIILYPVDEDITEYCISKYILYKNK